MKINEENLAVESDDIWLVYPAPCYMRDVRAFLNECLERGERHIQGGGNMEYLAPEAWLERVGLDRTLPPTETTSPAETVLAYRVMDGALVGCCQLRYHLTEKTRVCGGNIGYEVRPSLRKKGYGRKILEALLKHARERELEGVRVDVDERNTPSKKVIESCGGKLVGEDRIGSGETLQTVLHYNIDLKPEKQVKK